MKKIVVCIFACISLIGFVLSYANTSDIYKLSLSLSPEQNTNVVRFLYSHDDNLNNHENDFIEKMIYINDRNNTTIMKVSPIDQTHINYYAYFKNENVYQYADLIFTKHEMDRLNQNKYFLITNDQNRKADLYFPIFANDEKVYVHNLRNYDSIDGRYSFIGAKAKDSFLQLKQNFPSLSFELLSEDEIKINSNILDAPRIQTFIQLCVMLVIIAIICLLMYYSQIQEKIAIKKMFGYSSINILLKENRKMIFEVMVVNAFVFIVCFLISVKQFNMFSTLLIKYLLSFFLSEVIMLFIILVFLFYFFKKVEITNLLKHQFNYKGLLTLNLILRSMIVIFGVSIIGNYFKPMIDDVQAVLSSFHYQQNIEGYYKADNMQQFESDTVGYLHVLYNQLNESGGIGVETHYYGDLDRGHIPYLGVNANYINKMNIKDNCNKVLHINDNGYYILVPEIYKNEVNKFIKNELRSDITWKIKTIKDNQEFFTFDNSIHESAMGYVENPFIVVSDFVNPWFVYGTEKQFDKDEIYKVLVSKGYQATFDIYSVDETSKEQYQFTINRLKEEILLISISFMALCAVISQYVISYMNAFKKEIMIKKMMGHSLIKRYDRMLLIMTIFYLVIAAYYFVWNRPFIEQITVFVIFMFECLYSGFLIVITENKITAVSLKE
ncbi:DUF1430 domain-containing protein [Clostridiaceae bacterium DONG20-135]|uniref:DUF1430 domain-containing protein n=1 Tax=Copranaerobaculum intestinale TaxID=2692629 RepID=A0A6N8UAG1_9FIRM|nr:DUF1430 domain-containing protein [Copranaerobaculum intestinale]MXQ73723.1 DUF1430 domain-containing protein [Copranaerobaculum intestinale]